MQYFLHRITHFVIANGEIGSIKIGRFFDRALGESLGMDPMFPLMKESGYAGAKGEEGWISLVWVLFLMFGIRTGRSRIILA